ncbi:MBOAT family protein [Candidatus Lokiarchaeum ossiferum]|uniref:MBOAT family protein n=1 Tax=Candidatus Lokiarchaeum ossiferum TaxID=2951803 RepID=UPI00352ECDAA
MKKKIISKKIILSISVISNLILLIFFKYFNFITSSISFFSSKFGIYIDPIFLNILQITGISFFTFSAISYVVDIYHKVLDPQKNLLLFINYFCYFGKIISGPIEKPEAFFYELTKKKSMNWEKFSKSIQLILFGFFKKILIANRISSHSIFKSFYENPQGNGTLISTIVPILYTIQIYADFSGYTDIVRGVSLLFDINLSINFLEPYLATNIQKFWRRWHISLSTWFRDYLYIPLGGNRKGVKRTYINLMITMLLCGIWHGAGINFIIWGILHGVALMLHKFYRSNKNEKKHTDSRFIVFFNWFFTISFINIAWIFFRSENLGTVFLIFEEFFSLKFTLNLSFISLSVLFLQTVPFIIIIDVTQRIEGRKEVFGSFSWPIRTLLYFFMGIYILYFKFSYISKFIYEGF